MPRYFIEVAYKGTRYSGFQVQQNAVTIQAEIQKAFHTLHRQPVFLTGSSRTDAGVHALQNYFHFDYPVPLNTQFTYKMNAILPDDIVINQLYLVKEEAHSRFDAVSREYEYRIYRYKSPFLKGVAYYYPYKLDMERMQEAAAMVQQQTNFFAFCKTNSQVNNYTCTLYKSQWFEKEDVIVYNIEGNRFLRGMVRLLTASILKVGRHQIKIEQLHKLFTSDNEKCGFSVPADGLFLKSVNYPAAYFTA